MKSSNTVLLAVDEVITDAQLEQINKSLKGHKELGKGSYKMVNWAQYHSVLSRTSYENGSEDEDIFGAGQIEEADNRNSGNSALTQSQVINRRRNVVLQQKQFETKIEENLIKKDKERIDATIYGIEASINAWLNTERSKQNAFLRRKQLNTLDKSEE